MGDIYCCNSRERDWRHHRINPIAVLLSLKDPMPRSCMHLTTNAVTLLEE